MSSLLALLYLLAGVFSCCVPVAALVIVIKLSKPSALDAIPTAGSIPWLGSLWASVRFLTNGVDILQQGYEKYKTAPFKVAGLSCWIVVVSSREHVEELRRAPDDVLSVGEAFRDQLHAQYTMGPQIYTNPYHVPIVRSRLTRSIEALQPEITDEVATAFDDVLDLRGNEWKSVPAFSSMKVVVCRVSNRVFVGLPLCRDSGWIDLNIKYSIDISKGAFILSLFPDSLKPAAVWFLTNINQSRQRARNHLGPMIEKRQKYLSEHENERAVRPTDFLSWLMDEAQGPELTLELLATRILVVNFAAIHTSSSSFTHALLYLAANPQYIQPLREEVESTIEKEGWSKTALDKMRKVDSFLKECQRHEGISSVSLTRKAVKDFTFSDGTLVPRGTLVTAAAQCIHRDEAFYENAHTFKPFRFSDLRDADGQSVKYQYVSTAIDYLPFGHGRQACPGRFFTASVLKSMLAHVVLTYDIKLADGTACPRPLHIATTSLPNPSAKVVFRRRVD